MVLAALVLSACRVDDRFVCSSDAQCRRGEVTGTCEASSSCSFPDLDCSSGRRYDELAERSGQCVTDDDHDMIADDGDNCPDVANPDQFDEDGDKVGDACDPCPILGESAPGAGDDDGDGVGNLCDPRPAIAGEKIVLWEGFHTSLSSAWSVSGSAIVENDGLTLQGERIVTVPGTPTASETLLVAITMTEPPVTGVWLGMPFDSGVGGAYCELTPTALELWAEQATDAKVSSVPYSATINTPYVVGMQTLGLMQHRCTVRTASSSITTDVTGDSTSSATTPTIKIGCDAITRLGWVLLIEST